MGVPKFYGVFIRNTGYPGVLDRRTFNQKRRDGERVATLSLDFNAIKHSVAQDFYVYGEGEKKPNASERKKLIAQSNPAQLELEYFKAVADEITQIVRLIQPTETLVLAIDGVAPAAKINQQRQRRYRASKDRAGALFDSNSITPGTEMMYRFDNYLTRWLYSRPEHFPPNIIYSGHRDPGEGEHKIIDLMRAGKISGPGYHVLYGMDADLIMLALLAPLDQILLVRQDIYDVVSIDALRAGLREHIGTPTALTDFVVSMFFLGNDFLPHAPSLEDMSETIPRMLDFLARTKVSLTAGDHLAWSGIISLLQFLATNEPQLIADRAIVDYRFPSRMFNVALTRSTLTGNEFNFPKFRSAWYVNALGPARPDLDPTAFPTVLERVSEMGTRYLQGLDWVYRYYAFGPSRIDPSYVYPYFHAPLFDDVVRIATDAPPPFLETAPGDPNILVQLLAVIPPASSNLVPAEIRPLYRPDGILLNVFPESFLIERDGTNEEWRGIALIPPVDLRQIKEALDTVPLRPDLYTSMPAIEIHPDPVVSELVQSRNTFRASMDAMRGGRGRGGRGGRGRGRN